MTKTIKKSGFTLIELLIVIGLLAALAAVILPSLMGDRKEALSNIDKYNGAGTLRTLRLYETVTGGALPNGFHTGLATNDSSAVVMAAADPTFKTNATGCIVALSAEQVAALTAVGITKLAYGGGVPNGHDEDTLYGYEAVAATSYAIAVNEDWVDQNGDPITFNGKGIHYLEHENYSGVFAFFAAPTVNWEGTGTGWVKGFKVDMDVIARSPIVDGNFPYYIVYVGIQSGVFTEYISTSETLPIHMPEPKDTATEALEALKEKIEAITDGTGTMSFSWTDGSGGTGTTPALDEDGEVSVTVTSSDGTASIYTGSGKEFTFKITDKKVNVAKLLGTSAPNCVSTNP